jgi:hypothetical protein
LQQLQQFLQQLKQCLQQLEQFLQKLKQFLKQVLQLLQQSVTLCNRILSLQWLFLLQGMLQWLFLLQLEQLQEFLQLLGYRYEHSGALVAGLVVVAAK